MAIIRKKLLAKPAPPAGDPPRTVGRLGMNPAGKGKPAPKKPAEKAPAATKSTVKPAGKPVAKPSAAKAPAKAPQPNVPPVLNKGALAAKEAAAKRQAEAARIAAEKAEAEAKRPRKLVPATANAIRPGAAKAPPILPGTRPAPLARPLAPARPMSTNVRPGDSTGLQAKANAGQAARGA